MDNPQYAKHGDGRKRSVYSFKPYYKWITLNTIMKSYRIILLGKSFKPYYKWITLNTFGNYALVLGPNYKVLNLIING